MAGLFQIEKHPPQILLAGNPVRFEILSENAYSTAGGYACFHLHVNGTDQTADHNFSISFADKELIFTIRNTSGIGDPLIIPVATPQDTFLTWAEKIFAVFQSNYTLRKYYQVTIEYQTYYTDIIFTAITQGSDSTIVFDDLTSSGLVAGTNTAGVDPVIRENFGIVMNLWDNSNTLIGEDFKSLDDQGKTLFNISEYLISKMLSDDSERFEFPETGLVHIYERPDYVFPFTASFAESYEGSVHKMIFDNPRYAIAGGLNREILVFYNSRGGDYFSLPVNKRRFLTNAPLSKKTTRGMIEKLFFMLINTGDEYFYLSYRVNFTDNTSLEIEGEEITITASPTVVELLTGYIRLGIGKADLTKTVRSWEVWIENHAGICSEIRTYELDERYFENERQFLFRNSYSAYDTVRFTGKREDTLEHERVSAAQVLETEESSFNAPVKQFEINEQQVFKANSGWITRDEKDWLRDMLVSGEIYEIIGKQLVPFVIDSKKTAMFIDQEYRYNLEIEYNRSFTDRYYTALRGNRPLTADTSKVTADTSLITADQTTY